MIGRRAGSRRKSRDKKSNWTIGAKWLRSDGILLISTLIAAWILSWALSISSVKTFMAPLTFELSEKAEERQDAYSMNSIPSRTGPGVTVIDYNDASADALKAPNGDVAVPRGDIAKILDLVRAQPAAKMVFLDISIPYRPVGDEAGEQDLAQALKRWQDDPHAPALGIDAGAAPCQSFMRNDGYTTAFSIERFGAPLDAADRGERSSSSKIIWSCPIFFGLDQQLFSCVVGPSAAGQKTIALPSPGWFAEGVRRAQLPYSGPLKSKLLEADKRCMQNDFSGARRLRLTFPLEGDTSTLEVVAASDFLISPKITGKDGKLFKDRIIVIGSGTKTNQDVVETSGGAVFGPVMVAEALRSAWIFGFADEKPWWEKAIVASAIITVSYLILLALELLKMVVGERAPTSVRIILFIMSHPHLFGFAAIAVAIGFVLVNPINPNWDFTDTAATLFLMEWLFLLKSLLEEWEHERV